MEASVRLQNELRNFQRARSYGFYARPNPKDVLEWKCQLHHKGHFFALTMVFPQNYPVAPPRIKFDSTVYHPNVFSDNSVCLDILSSKWSPSLTIKDILAGLKQLLDFPNPESPANTEAADLFSRNTPRYQRKVAECYSRHHSKYQIPRFG